MSDENHSRFHAACEAIDVGPPALKLLLGMEPGVGTPMRVFADKLRCDASWVTALVDDLEGHGYVERRILPTDRRVRAIVITRAGLAAQAKARRVLHKAPASMHALSAAEQRKLRDLLVKMQSAASAQEAAG
ncbi:MAG TPA: MarR family transcriptional regulator [Acidimicrobiales bacterium]|nr:MarR family transcriptional regulator [Acidimicrobiales bacterium]